MIVNKKNINASQAKKIGDFILYKSNYVFIYKSMIGTLNGIVPWIDPSNAEFAVKHIESKDRIIMNFFAFSQKTEKDKLKEAIGIENVNFLLDSGYAKTNGLYVIPDNYVLIPVFNKLIAVNTVLKTEKQQKNMMNLYIGEDSMKLINFISTIKGGRILDMCAGPGTIGIAISDYATKIDFVEINDNAINALNFNLLINDISLDKVNVYKSDMFKQLNERKYDYIVSNPPFVSTPQDAVLPLCGDGGEDGLKYAKEIIFNAQKYLNTNGKLFMVLEAVGNDNAPFVVKLLTDNFQQGVLNVSLMKRQVIELQSMYCAKISSEITSKQAEYDYLYEKWQKMFERDGVTYIYPTIIEYINKAENLRMNIVRNYDEISRHSKFVINDNIVLHSFDKKMYRINVDGKSIIFDDDVASLLKSGSLEFDRAENKNSLYNHFEKMNIVNYMKENGVIKFV